MNDRDERLHQFFAGYFNQDWDIDGAMSWTDVVDEFLNQNSNAHAAKIRDDLQSWLAQQQASLPAAFGCDYNPGRDGMAERAWAQALLAYLERKLAN